MAEIRCCKVCDYWTREAAKMSYEFMCEVCGCPMTCQKNMAGCRMICGDCKQAEEKENDNACAVDAFPNK